MKLLDTGMVIDIMENNNYTPAIISPITLLEYCEVSKTKRDL